jgi:hypothetical protein
MYKVQKPYVNDPMDIKDWDRACFKLTEDDGFADDTDDRSRRRELSEELLRPCRLWLVLLGGGFMPASSMSRRERLGDGPGPGRLYYTRTRLASYLNASNSDQKRVCP